MLYQLFKNCAQAVEVELRHASSYVNKHHIFVLIGIVLIGFFFRLAIVDFSLLPLFYATDPYFYLLKALEIVHGDWTPLLTHSYGISILLAPFLKLAGGAVLGDHILIATAFSVFLGALFTVPVYLVARPLVGVGGSLVVAFLVAVHPMHVSCSTFFLTDVLFAHAILFSTYCMIRGSTDIRFFYVMSIIAGLTYWLRPNGWIILIPGLLMFMITYTHARFRQQHVSPRYTKKALIVHSVMLVLTCFLIASPMLHARYVTFGSAFTYGENDKIFSHEYTHDVWAPNIPTPTFTDFFETYGIVGVIDKFFVGGVLKLLHIAFFSEESIFYPILILPMLYGVFLCIRKKTFLAVHITLLVCIAFYALVFDIMANGRYLLFMTPLLLLYFYTGFTVLLRGKTYRYLVACCTIFLVSINAFLSTVTESARYSFDRLETYPVWSYWVSENIRGTLLVPSGGEYPLHHMSDTRISASRSMFEYEAPASDLRIRHYGSFDSINEALIWHVEHQNATHLLVDSQIQTKRPYLRKVDDAVASGLLKELYAGFDGVGYVKVYAIDQERVKNMLEAKTSTTSG